MSVVEKVLRIRCDSCGLEKDTEDEGARNWGRWRWRPGIVRNTEPRPDMHACPREGCAERVRELVTARDARLDQGWKDRE